MRIGMQYAPPAVAGTKRSRRKIPAGMAAREIRRNAAHREQIVVGVRPVQRRRPYNRALMLTAAGALFSLLSTLGFWMVQAYTHSESARPADNVPLTAVREGTDWTGGLARQAEAARGPVLAMQDKPGAKPSAPATKPEAPAGKPDEPGVKKIPPTTPAASTGSSTPEPAKPDPEAKKDKTDDGAPRGAGTSSATITSARQQIEAGKFVEARKALNEALKNEKNAATKAELRTLLASVADKTIFSDRQVPGDPLIETYTIQEGDNLIAIGKRFDVASQIIAHVNGLKDPNNVAAGKQIKVPKGPFHATVIQSEFRIDLYLQDTYVRSYPVGLGKEKRTPNGLWKVVDRIPNPTYYPSESAEVKEVIAGGDPKNPLGAYWLKLEGVEGDAVGQVGFGIHGTNAPDSIGKSESLGCVRMRNEDVSFVFKLLRPGTSTVRILP